MFKVWETLQVELRPSDTTTANSAFRKPDLAPVLLACLFQWAQSYLVKSNLPRSTEILLSPCIYIYQSRLKKVHLVVEY